MLEFDRRYVLLPVLLGVAFVVAAFLVTESGREARIESVAAIQRSQERNRLLAELQLVATDAESAQRGYLLTGDEQNLEPYRQSKIQVDKYLKELRAAYSNSEASMADKSSDLANLVTTKFAEVDATLVLYEKGRSQAMALVRTDFGQRSMDGVRDLTRQMRAQEREYVSTRTDEWLHSQQVNRAITAGGAMLNVLLILLAGALVTREIKRRTAVAMDLESQVAKATVELSELSTSLQRVSERERSSLARELHDELGGLLIAIKMDLSQLKTQIDLSQNDVRARWDRIQSTLSAGIDLKRRVIEQLRPSLLDNMGLIAALKWQTGEICSGAKLVLAEHYPETEPTITADASITIFRIAQEALTNIVKHAHATHVEVALVLTNDRLVLQIEDDGVGIPADRERATGSHGIAGMKHRLISNGGQFKLEQKTPRGTRLVASLPLMSAPITAQKLSAPIAERKSFNPFG
jgi:signal transduction histidine kinase